MLRFHVNDAKTKYVVFDEILAFTILVLLYTTIPLRIILVYIFEWFLWGEL